jgi:hypothetical protein
VLIPPTPERSEGSPRSTYEILRFAQNDVNQV